MARYESSSDSKGTSKADVTPIEAIDQPIASKAAHVMYNNNEFVVSDLINSYAWDTAIVYIQKCSSTTNYANYLSATTTLNNTGESGDVQCNIYDMSGNVSEFTTEYAGTGTYIDLEERH